MFIISARNAWDFSAIYKTYRLLKKEKFDVLNTHSGHDSIWAAAGARLAKTPLIVRTRHLAVPVTSLFSYRFLAHRVVAVSRYVEKHLVQRGLPQNRVVKIYDAIAPPPFSRAQIPLCVKN